MTHRIRPIHTLLVGAALLLTTSVSAFAQEGGGPDMAEVREKVRLVDRLMRQAERSLAKSLDPNAARTRAERVSKILDEKAKEAGTSMSELQQDAASGSKEASATLERLTQEARAEAARAAEEMQRTLDERAREMSGKSADELRKLAEEGSQSAAETLEQLMQGAGGQSGGASEGVRQLLEKTQKSGQGVSSGIQWLLDNATSHGGSGSGQGPQPKEKQKKPGGEDPKDPKEDPKDKPKGGKPPSETEDPNSPKVEAWLAALPAQVRKAYENEEWDAIPEKWRDILKVWTKKMADELERKRK